MRMLQKASFGQEYFVLISSFSALVLTKAGVEPRLLGRLAEELTEDWQKIISQCHI